MASEWPSRRENPAATPAVGFAPIPAAEPSFQRTTRQARASSIHRRPLPACAAPKPCAPQKRSPGLHDDRRPCSGRAVTRLINMVVSLSHMGLAPLPGAVRHLLPEEPPAGADFSVLWSWSGDPPRWSARESPILDQDPAAGRNRGALDAKNGLHIPRPGRDRPFGDTLGQARGSMRNGGRTVSTIQTFGSAIPVSCQGGSWGWRGGGTEPGASALAVMARAAWYPAPVGAAVAR